LMLAIAFCYREFGRVFTTSLIYCNRENIAGKFDGARWFRICAFSYLGPSRFLL
jgi:hypothetical protein